MREDDLRESSNIEDRRGSPGFGGMRTGGLGIGAVVVLSLLGWAFGINPAVLINGAEQATGGNGPAVSQNAPARPAVQGTPTDQVGHHVQNLLGLLPKVQAAERQTDQATANDLSVRTELMADCLAGVWANHMNERHRNIDESDLRQGASTAAAIGDDRLSQAAGRAVVRDSFTHGSSEQRVRWLVTGLRTGTIAGCNTFQP